MADPSSSYRPNPLAIASLVGHNGLQQQDHFTMEDLDDSHFDIPHSVAVSHSPVNDSLEHLPMDDGDFDPHLEASSSKASGGLLGGNSKQSQKQQESRPKKHLWVPPPTFPYNLIPGRDLSAPLHTQTITSSSFKDFQPKAPKGPRKSSSKKKKPVRESDDEDAGDLDDSTLAMGANGMNDEALDGMLQMDVDVEEEGSAANGASASVAPPKKKEKGKSTVKQSAHSTPTSASKAGGRAKTEKARAAEQEKEDRERVKVDKATTKTSSKTKNASSSSKDTSSRAKSGSGSFASNQGVRVDGARNAVVEESYEDDDIEEEVVDTHLYCVCKQLYDDDRVMIACDNCDEWYHPKCVGLLEEDLELVDMFICPPCVASNPNIGTTYKVSCVQCRRPARLPLSKFCSDECGIQCVMDRVDRWNISLEDGTQKSADWMDRLYASTAVRSAKRREGLVSVTGSSRFASNDARRDAKHEEDERALARHRQTLENLGTQRRGKMRKVAALEARLLLLEVAVKRTEANGFESRCGFDIRIGLDEGAWEEWVESEDGRKAFEGFGPTEEDSEREREELKRWLCSGRKKCERHSGWQKMKRTDFELERDVLQRAVQKLRTRERDLRTRVEDILALRTPPGSVAGNGDATTRVIEPDSRRPELNGMTEHTGGYQDVEMDSKVDEGTTAIIMKKSTSPSPNLGGHSVLPEDYINGTTTTTPPIGQDDIPSYNVIDSHFVVADHHFLGPYVEPNVASEHPPTPHTNSYQDELPVDSVAQRTPTPDKNVQLYNEVNGDTRMEMEALDDHVHYSASGVIERSP